MVDAPRPAPSASRDLRETWYVMRVPPLIFEMRFVRTGFYRRSAEVAPAFRRLEGVQMKSAQQKNVSCDAKRRKLFSAARQRTRNRVAPSIHLRRRGRIGLRLLQHLQRRGEAVAQVGGGGCAAAQASGR